jgi:hypothetical protein
MSLLQVKAQRIGFRILCKTFMAGWKLDGLEMQLDDI